MFKRLLAIVIVLCAGMPAISQNINPGTDWKLGIQLWTFNTSSLYTAIKKADSCNVKYVEAFPFQQLSDEGPAVFGPPMTADERKKLKEFLRKKGIAIAAVGVFSATSVKDWKEFFEFAADMKIPMITAEPERNQLNDVNRLAATYNIKVAIHDHPIPDIYWHPDSVLLAIKGRPNLGVCADIGHWVRNGLNVVDCLKKCSGRIFELHLKDVAEFGNTQAPDVLLGEGVCNIPAVLQELKSQDFKGLFAIEYEEHPNNNMKDIKQHVQYFYTTAEKLK
ncbi:MAG: sugar phosphate isomerase/epimerase family protein [Panacibacter sp.]